MRQSTNVASCPAVILLRTVATTLSKGRGSALSTASGTACRDCGMDGAGPHRGGLRGIELIGYPAQQIAHAQGVEEPTTRGL
jgi:hypothetical protein